MTPPLPVVLRDTSGPGRRDRRRRVQFIIASGAPDDDLVCARTLLIQARERISTLRQVVVNPDG